MRPNTKDPNSIDPRSAITFDEARTRALYDGILAILARCSNSLIPNDVIRLRLHLLGESYQGLQSIPVDRIVGSELALSPEMSTTRGYAGRNAFYNIRK
ncbi:MAG: hypothetical protein A3J97_07330 [Spirochaetes bacterium RIFOXYC1_FULL_54_7]|nr:MAG: hypothetical protein A3J97_07330 [Spirochaetes bacterium RIFOXYC1_FULL_54_7]